MYILIRCTDETYHICKDTQLPLFKRGLCKDKKKTAAHLEIVVRHSNFELLHTLKTHMECGFPKVRLCNNVTDKVYSNFGDTVSVTTSDIDKENDKDQCNNQNTDVRALNTSNNNNDSGNIENVKTLSFITDKENFLKCGAEVAHLLPGTKLRKHIATFCASLELADTEVSDFANFMGHADKIHKEIYRQPVISRDILNITQHLEAAHGCDSEKIEENFDGDNIDDGEIRKEVNKKATNEGTNSSFDISTNVNSSVDTSASTENTSVKRRSGSPYGRTKRKRWNKNEKTVVLTTFDQVMKSGKLPSLQEIGQVIKNIPA